MKSVSRWHTIVNNRGSNAQGNKAQQEEKFHCVQKRIHKKKKKNLYIERGVQEERTKKLSEANGPDLIK